MDPCGTPQTSPLSREGFRLSVGFNLIAIVILYINKRIDEL